MQNENQPLGILENPSVLEFQNFEWNLDEHWYEGRGMPGSTQCTHRCVKHPIPFNWSRIIVDVPNGNSSFVHSKIKSWILENCEDKFSMIYYPLLNIIVIGFKDDNDAILFKLKDGHKSYEN